MSAISPISSLPLTAPQGAGLALGEGGLGAGPEKAAAPGASFEGILKGMVEHANQTSLVADQQAAEFAAGRVDDIHGTMIAIKKADIELHLVSTVRTKLVDAFNDLWRMNV